MEEEVIERLDGGGERKGKHGGWGRGVRESGIGGGF